MFEGLFDKKQLEYVHSVIAELSSRSLGSFMFAIPTYMEGDVESVCDDLDSYVRVYVPNADVKRASPPFGSIEEWMEYGVMVITKPIGPSKIGQGTVIPVKMIEDLNPEFQVRHRICDTMRQEWYENDTIAFLKQLQTKLRE